MEITRILRVLVTILLVVTFILVTVSAYTESREIGAMVRLSDATSSIVTRLATDDLAWTDDESIPHSYVLDADLLDNLESKRSLGGDNFAFQVSIFSQVKNFENFGLEPPEGRMTCSLVVPAALRHLGGVLPARLEVVAWYA
jgi:hypothetical protein